MARCSPTPSPCRRGTTLQSRRGSTSGCTGGRTTLPNPSSFSASRPSGRATCRWPTRGRSRSICSDGSTARGWHWAGEADVFEGIAAVKKRFKIDDRRVLLRGFSMGGEGAWHIALHYPDRFAAAEIGAGTWSRRGQTPGLAPYQYAALEDLGKHGGVGAERLQSAAGRPRRRYRYADRVAARSAAGHAQSRPAGVFAAHARPVGAGGFPGRRRARFPASERHSRHLPDLAEYGTRHQPAGPPAAGRLSEGVGRQGPDLAGAHSLRHLHHALQPRLLDFGGRAGKALRARRHRRAARYGRRQVRDQDAQRVAPGAARDGTRETDHDRRTDAEGEVRSPRSRCRRTARSVEGGEGRRLGGPAQDACAARSDRRCLPRPLPAGAPHRHAMERRGQSAGAARAWPASTGCGASISAAIRS